MGLASTTSRLGGFEAMERVQEPHEALDRELPEPAAEKRRHLWLVDVDPGTIRAALRDRRVLVTGAGGSIGSEICRQVAAVGPRSWCCWTGTEDLAPRCRRSSGSSAGPRPRQPASSGSMESLERSTDPGGGSRGVSPSCRCLGACYDRLVQCSLMGPAWKMSDASSGRADTV